MQRQREAESIDAEDIHIPLGVLEDMCMLLDGSENKAKISLDHAPRRSSSLAPLRHSSSWLLRYCIQVCLGRAHPMDTYVWPLAETGTPRAARSRHMPKCYIHCHCSSDKTTSLNIRPEITTSLGKESNALDAIFQAEPKEKQDWHQCPRQVDDEDPKQRGAMPFCYALVAKYTTVE